MDTNTFQSITNINGELLSILKGAHEAGKEIYSVSKDTLIKSVEFVSQQTPDIIEQFLHWKFYQATIDLIFCIGMILGCLAIMGYIVHYYKKVKKGEWEVSVGFEAFHPFIIIASIIISVVMIIGIFNDISLMVQIKMAPKVYLIDYVTDIVKKNNR